MTAQAPTRAAGRYRLGVDIGGTFTDFLVMDEASGEALALKVPSTAEPEEAILEGLAQFDRRHGIVPSEIDFFSHGTTIAVNTLLERTGEEVGVITTRGFRDVLELRRLRLPKANDFFVPKPVALTPRRNVREVDERVLADGSVLVPLDLDQVEAEARSLHAAGIRTFAVCFLHAYRNPAHEAAARARIAEVLPDAYVCTSSEIWPQQREYERFLISVMNAYVGARMKRYFATLRARTSAAGLTARVFSTKSNGGVMSLEAAAAKPVETLLSGPAAGVIGAAHVGRQAGEPMLVTLDMGGTSVDVAVVGGEVPYSSENTVGDFPVIMPAIDVSAIGAGGGSIAWTDTAGVLKVGPRSAGAVPGPAAYGRGGTQATVTDAYVVSGICNPDFFLGGTMRLDVAAAEAAVGEIGARMGLELHAAAEAILSIATANIYSGLVPQLARRGAEARDCALVAYGAAGPTHSFLLARELPFRKVIVPPTPGTLCALGCLVADLRADFVRTVWAGLDALDDAAIAALYRELEAEAREWLAAEKVELEAVHLIRSADLCYVGQSFELNVPFPDAPPTRAAIAEWFHDRYDRVYGRAEQEKPLRLVEARVQIVGVLKRPPIRFATGQGEVPAGHATRRRVHDQGRFVEAAVHHRAALVEGQMLYGPAVIEQYDTTIWVPEGFVLTIDGFGNLIGERL